MPSLADLAKRARKGEKVRGGTEIATGEEGTEQYIDQGVVTNRRVLSGTYETPEQKRKREEDERKKKTMNTTSNGGY